MATAQLPTLNAFLNATAFVLLLWGWREIRAGRREAHRRRMIAALLVSVAFLASYLIYHARHGSTPFPGTGLVRGIYFAILIPHSILAAVQVPLIVITVALALRGHEKRHRRWARITLPIWLYVSLTGVLVYTMLYHGPW